MSFSCPVGVATQDHVLRKKFAGRPEHVVNFFFFVAEEARQIMAQLGITKFNDLIGRSDLLDTKKSISHWKARGLDFTRIFHQPEAPAEVPRFQCEKQDHGLERALDIKLIERCLPAIERGEKVQFMEDARNGNRSVGAMLSGELIRRRPEGLPDHTIFMQMEGTGGQSFGRPGCCSQKHQVRSLEFFFSLSITSIDLSSKALFCIRCINKLNPAAPDPQII